MLLPKPLSCASCPLAGDMRGFVPDKLVGGSSVALILQNPGQMEEQGQRVTGYIAGKPVVEPCTHQPLTGATGFAVAGTWLPKAGLHADDVSYLNILKCRWTLHGKRTNKLPKDKSYYQAVRHCMQAHFRIPDSVTTLVAAGDHAFKTLGGAGLEQPDGKPATISSYRGYVLPDMLGVINGKAICRSCESVSSKEQREDKSISKVGPAQSQSVGAQIKAEIPL